jgi:hypothetical protein
LATAAAVAAACFRFAAGTRSALATGAPSSATTAPKITVGVAAATRDRAEHQHKTGHQRTANRFHVATFGRRATRLREKHLGVTSAERLVTYAIDAAAGIAVIVFGAGAAGTIALLT